MKKNIFMFLIVVLTFILVGCSPKESTPTDTGANKAPNVYTVSSKLDSAPIYDSETDKVVGNAFKGFAISLENEKEGKVYFSVNTTSSDPSQHDKSAVKNFYLSTKDLEKTYKEEFFVIEIISLDAILLNENAPIYDENDNCIAKFQEKLGPIRYIQKTDKGYQLVLAQNLVYIKEKDVTFIKLSDK